MRIALISNSLPPDDGTGGAQAYVADLGAALGARHDVLILSGTRDARVVADQDGSEEGQRVPTTQLPSLPHLLSGDPLARKVRWHLQDQWIPAVHLAVMRQLEAFSPDVVHTHEPQGLSAAPFSAIARARLPHVHTVHDLNLFCVRVTMTRERHPCSRSCLECRLQRSVRIPLVQRQLRRLICPSDYYRDLHIGLGIVRPERAITIRQGAKPGRARVRTETASPTIGMLGALAPHKGLHTLLKAFESAPASWRLHVAGSGPDQDDVVVAATVDSRIRYHGIVDGPGKEAFFDRIDVLAIPSEWEENAPLVAAEAAVRGIPTVVSDRGGLPETSEAEVFTAGDPKQLQEAIAALVRPGGRLPEASARLLEKREKFLWDPHVRRVEAVLEASATTRVASAPRGAPVAKR